MGAFSHKPSFVWDKKYCRRILTIFACLLFLETVISEDSRLPKKVHLNQDIVLDRQKAKAEERYLSGWFQSQINRVKIRSLVLAPHENSKINCASVFSLSERTGVKEKKGKSPDLISYKVPKQEALNPSRGRAGGRRSSIEAPDPTGVLREKTLITPVTGRLTSPYGRRGRGMHWGIDLAAPKGTPVRAAASGSVDYAGWASGYGLLVILNHGGFRTFYAHNSRLQAHKGQKLKAGVIIAEVGRTGRATGDHLHFEVEVKGIKIDPLPYLKH